MTTVVLVQQGGTGSNNAADARASLGAAPSAAYDQANSAFAQANAAIATANNGNSGANAAYAQANAAYDQANSAFAQANLARSDANTTFAAVNVTFGTVNTSITNAHNQANTATIIGQNAYAQANLAYAASNNSNLLLGGLVSGTLNVSQDLIVGGNIYLEGNTTYINVSTYSIEDSLVYYASNNKLTDSVDIGFMGGKNTSGTYSHTGFVRDATDGKWKLFDGLPEEGHVGNVVNFANTYLATLVANVEANNITVLGNKVAVNTEVAAAYNQANSAYTAANNRVLKAGDTMTGSLTLGAGRTVGAGGIVLSHTGLNTDVLANGRTAGVSTGWGTFRIHQEAGNPGLIIAGDASQTAPYMRIQNNAESALVVVDSSGNLGVGTSSPTGKSHSSTSSYVPSDSNITKAAFVASGAYGGGITLNDTGLGTIWMQSSGTLMGFGVGTTSGASGTMYLRNGSVGIAQIPTVSTTSSLFNNGDFTIAGSNRSILGNIYYSSGWKYAANGYGWGFRENASGLVQFITFPNNTSGAGAAASDTYLMTLDIPNQRVGIGTVSPTNRLSISGTCNATGDFRAPIFYDSDNTSYYVNPADGGFNLRGGNSNRVTFSTNDSGFRVDNAEGSGGSDLRLGAAWGYNGVYHSGNLYLSTGGSATHFVFSPGTSKGYIDSSGVMQVTGSHRAPIFYDSDDTNAYFDGGGAFVMRGGSPTIYFRDTDHNSAMLHNNGNLLYVLRGGNDTTSWSQVSGQWPFIFYLSNNDALCGGAFSAVGNVTAYASDRRLKTNIQKIPNALDKVLSLNGVTFDWIDRVKEIGFKPDTMINDAGIIAQEVQAVLPQAVKPAPFDREWDNDKNEYVSRSGEDFITVQYEKLVPLLIEAIKELKAEIDTLKQRG